MEQAILRKLFPPAVKEVSIKKQGGGVRKLGIPTILDRIAQQVVKLPLERIVEPLFHESSFGYRPGRSCHQVVDKALKNAFHYKWMIDLDIKGFFDNIDHGLLLKAVSHYCKEPWILMYIKRWLGAGILQEDGLFIDRLTGTPQGGVVSPLLSNIYLHVVFDKWMEKNYPEKPFERYADDIVVHCTTEAQALFLKRKIEKRMAICKLELHSQKTKIIHFRGETENRYPRCVDFLGFKIKVQMIRTKIGFKLLPTTVISQQSKHRILEKFRLMKLHKLHINIEALSKMLTPIIRGMKNYYCKFWTGHMHDVWFQINMHLTKWVRWERRLTTRAALRWLREKYRVNPRLFPHWELAHP